MWRRRAKAAGWIDPGWIFAAHGVLALLFGATVLLPKAALPAVMGIFRVWLGIGGASALVLALAGRRSWQLALLGFFDLVVAGILFAWPGLTPIGLYGAVAGWSIARGALEAALAPPWLER